MSTDVGKLLLLALGFALTFFAARTLGARWRARRRERTERAAQANETRQVRRARERKQRK